MAKFGKEAVRLAQAGGITIEELGRAINRSKSVIERLQQGKARMEVAAAVKRELIKRKINTSTLPPIDPTEPEEPDEPEIAKDEEFSEDEWMRIGHLISAHAPRVCARFLHELREVAAACEVLERAQLKDIK